MAVDFENAHDRANTTTGNLTENESFDEISAVNKQISSLKRSVSDMIAELNNGKAVWEDAKLLLTYSSMSLKIIVHTCTRATRFELGRQYRA